MEQATKDGATPLPFCSRILLKNFGESPVVFSLDILNDDFVHVISRGPDRLTGYNPRQGDDRHFRLPPADIHYHISRGFGDRKSAPMAAAMGSSIK